jgi:simple sugar transport system ATP-binding protein
MSTPEGASPSPPVDRTGGDVPTLELKGITKRYGGVVACQDVSLGVHSGEVVALVGNNGAGKSTILRIVSGAQVPDAGEIRLEGKKVTLKSVHAARENGIEAVPQELALAPKQDVVTNIFLGREITHGPRWLGFRARRKMEKEAKHLIETLGSDIPHMRAKVGTLSGGQRQATAIARAVGWGRSVVVLDEPTAALGVHETAQVEKSIRHMKDMGLSILLVSHDIEQVFRVADRVYVLYHGRVVTEERPLSSTRERVVAFITSGDESQ